MGFLRDAIDTFLESRTIAPGGREVTAEERWRHLRAYGDTSLAFSAVSEPYLLSFGDSRGFIPYARRMGYSFALGDPIAAPADRAGLIDDFIAAFRRPGFVAVGQDTASLLASRGYRVNHFGYDTAIRLHGHSFAGREGKNIRYATSWLKANGMTVEERRGEDFAPGTLKRISLRWRETRVANKRQIRFLNRVFSESEAPGVRRFFALTPAGEPLAFISFDPIHRGGRVIGYLASNKRRDPEASGYVDLGIMRHAIDVFKTEGLDVALLGLSPLAGLERGPFRGDPLVRRLFRVAYDSPWVNSRIFNMQGIAAYKKRFRGEELPNYLALPPGRGRFLMLIALLRLIRLI